jgi:hypothetical protein
VTPPPHKQDTSTNEQFSTVFAVAGDSEVSVIDLLNGISVGLSRLSRSQDGQIIWFMTGCVEPIRNALKRLEMYFSAEAKYHGAAAVPRFRLVEIPAARKLIEE